MTGFKVGLVPIGRIQFDMALANEVRNAFLAKLGENEFEWVGPQEIVTDLPAAQAAAADLAGQEIDLLLVLQTTFADSTMVMALAQSVHAPLMIWAPPDERTGARLRLNTLTGINLACHALNLQGIPYEYAYAALDDANAWGKLRATAAAGRVMRKFKQTTLGVVGQHPAGMETCYLDAAQLKQWLGVTIREYALPPVFERIRAADPARVAAVRERLDQRLDNLATFDQKPLNVTLAAYTVLKELGQQENLQGVAVRCWPEFFTELGGAACGAISLLSDDKIPATCEADINGTVTQLALQWLSGGEAFATDIVQADVAADEIVLWHCGQAPLSMADPEAQPHGTLHSNRKLPLLMDFPLKPGVVTLARFSRAGGDFRLVLGRGEMLRTTKPYSGTTGVFRPERSAQVFLDTLLGEGLEHHLALTYGDHVAELQALAKFVKLPTLVI